MPYDYLTDEEKEAVEEAKKLLQGTGYEIVRSKTLEDIHPADREYSSAYHDRWGDKVTANGIAWEERMCDMDYINTVRFGSNRYGDEYDPSDYDDYGRSYHDNEY